ncbi:MAG: carbon-nitrogen hydrolase family protein [bacterium]
MRVAAVQFKARKGDLGTSLRVLATLAQEAAEDADLVVLPEMAATGYIFPTAEDVAAVAEAPDGPTYQRLAPIAAQHGAWIVAGFPERAGDRLYNSALVIDDQGGLAFVYRKRLLFEADEHWATPGDSGYRRFETAAGAFGVGICMDLNDDRFLYWCARARLDAVAFPTNWLEQGIDVVRYWALRMFGQRAALVAANTHGSEGEVEFAGRSSVLAGRTLLASAPMVGDGIVRARLTRRVG